MWYLGFFHVWPIANKAATNSHMRVSVWTEVFVSFGRTPRSAMLDRMENLFGFVSNRPTVFPSGCTVWDFLLLRVGGVRVRSSVTPVSARWCLMVV